MTEANQSQRWGAYYEQLKDRPPRKTLLRALDLFGVPPAEGIAVDGNLAYLLTLQYKISDIYAVGGIFRHDNNSDVYALTVRFLF